MSPNTSALAEAASTSRTGRLADLGKWPARQLGSLMLSLAEVMANREQRQAGIWSKG